MGLTSSIEKTFDDDDINYEHKGDLNTWQDIVDEIDDEKLEASTKILEHIPEVNEETEEVEGGISENEAVEETRLREMAEHFVDDVIRDTITKMNKEKIEEEMFIPSDDNLYAESLQEYLESTYEYHDEIDNGVYVSTSEGASSEDTSSEDDSCVESVGCSRYIYDLRDACAEFVDEMSGLNNYDDYCDDDGDLGINEYIASLIENERPHFEELKKNCLSLKTSYHLVKDCMNEFLVNNRKTLCLGFYSALFYMVLNDMVVKA